MEGTAEYNVEALKPEIITNGADVQIKIKDVLNLVEPRGIKSKWDLQLGAVPMDLNINAGAYQGNFQFGGLSLTGLTVKDGAAQVDLDFNKPNLSNMTVFRYETGASQVTMTGLANANFSTMILNSGAGDYKLDYSRRSQARCHHHHQHRVEHSEARRAHGRPGHGDCRDRSNQRQHEWLVDAGRESLLAPWLRPDPDVHHQGRCRKPDAVRVASTPRKRSKSAASFAIWTEDAALALNRSKRSYFTCDLYHLPVPKPTL